MAEYANVLYQGDNGILVRSVSTFLGPCYIIHDTNKNTNVELMAMQFKAMVNRVKSKDREYGSFPHGGFDVNNDSVTIYHDDNRKKYEVTVSFDELNKITVVLN